MHQRTENITIFGFQKTLKTCGKALCHVWCRRHRLRLIILDAVIINVNICFIIYLFI